MRSAEDLQAKYALFENAPSTSRNQAVLTALSAALVLRDDIDLSIADAAAAVIPGDVLSVAPYDAWVWADGTAEHLDPDTDAPKAEAQIDPADEEAKK